MKILGYIAIGIIALLIIGKALTAAKICLSSGNRSNSFL